MGIITTRRALQRTDEGALAEVTSLLVVALLFLVIWLPLSAPSVRGDVYLPPDDTVAKFRMSLGNHGNPPRLFPRVNDTLWITNTSSPVLSSPVVSAGRVYVGTMGGSVLCLSATTGSVLWEHVTGGPIESTPAIEGGRVYIGSDDNRLHCVDAGTGEPIWSTTTGGEIKSSPAVWQGLVIVGSNDFGVHCFNATTGIRIWNFSTGGWVYSSPAVWEGRAYIGSCDGRLYCMNASTGAEIWRFEAAFMPASPAVVDGIVVVGAYDDRFYALDAVNGTEIWNVTVGEGGIYSSATVLRPASHDNIVALVASNNGNLSWVQNGLIRQTWEFGEAIKSSPVFAVNLEDVVPYPQRVEAILLGTEGGTVYAINTRPSMIPPPGYESWWHLDLGTSITASPFIYNNRVYISASNGDGGIVACIGDILPGEETITIDEPAQDAHVVNTFKVMFNGTGVEGKLADILIGEMTFPATWRGDHWEASVSLGATLGPVRVLVRVHGSGDSILIEDSVDVVVRDPKSPNLKVVIVNPKEGVRVDPIAVASGRVEGEYPPLRLEASWDGSGCWTAFVPMRNWTLALTTVDLYYGHHTLHVRAFDGFFTVEDSVKVKVGDVQEDYRLTLWSILAIIGLLAVVAALIMTRPVPPPRT